MENKETIETKEFDITKYPEGPMEIIKHMGYLPVPDEERLAYLTAYITECLSI